MRRAFAVLSLIALCGLAAAAQTPIVLARLEPATGIIVGQPVHLVVEVLVPNYFTGSPDFPEFEIENAIVVLPQERPQNVNEQINGTTYAGIIETYSLYPQQPGDFHLPPAQLTVPYASNPPKTTVAQVPLPSLTFHADLPAEARNLDYFLPTTQLTMQQKWNVPLKNLRAGDTIERTITVTATKMQAMLIPPLPSTAPDGIRVYQTEPTVSDQKTDRGDFVSGQRIQTTKYFIQKEGDYTLPAVELKWWNLSTKRIVTTTLPAVHFDAAANPDLVTELPPEPEAAPVTQPQPVNPWIKYKRWIEIALASAISLFLLIWLCRKYLPRLRNYIETERERKQHTEATYFRNLIQSCQRNNAPESYAWLLKWINRIRANGSVDDFVKESNNPELNAEINLLGSALFAASPQQNSWKGTSLATHLKEFREARKITEKKRTQLPFINPGAENAILTLRLPSESLQKSAKLHPLISPKGRADMFNPQMPGDASATKHVDLPGTKLR
jgi:hypothetical protein